jgi:signal transduction histidine kinase/ligand-binding sensor domain-containing protein
MCYGQQYNFRSYSLEEGLPQSQVNALIQDKAGNLWVGTNGGGLCRFNGKEFQVFTKKHGLPDNIVSALHQDQTGMLWIATSKGITSYDGRVFEHFLEDRGVNDGRYFWISSDEQGKLWVVGVENQGGRKILYLEDGKFNDFTDEHPGLTEDNFVLGGILNHDKQLQIVTKNGLYRYDGRRLERSPLEKLVPEDHVAIPLLEDSRGNLWLASGEYPNINDLHVFKNGTLSPVQLPGGISLNQLRAPFEDSHGNIWSSIVGSGVLKTSFDSAGNPSFQVFNRNNGLPINMINHILEDREGNIWFGSNGGGLIKYSSEKFVALNLEDGLSSEIIWAITRDTRGDYWFGTGGGAIIKYNGSQIQNVLTEEESPLGLIKKFLVLDNGNLLIGSLNGLWEYDGSSFNKVNEVYGLPDAARIADIIRDGNELLISVYGKGVARFDGRKSTFITAERDSIATNSMDHLMKDSKGNIWMASKSMGVSKYQADPLNSLEPQDQLDGARVVNYNSNNGLNNDYILQIAEDRYGNLWLASYGGGLNIFDGKEFTYLDTEQGLTSDNIYSVIADDDGNIWAGTQNGVDKITLNDQGKVEQITNYDKYDGFTGIETNGMANFKDKDGNLWFGTIKGVMRYKPSADRFNPTPPVTNITRMKLFFKDVDWNESSYQEYRSGIQSWHHLPQDLTLPHDMNHVSFNFEALSFQVPEKVKYQWKLDGLDKEWAPVTSKTEAVYPNLPPGSYTFHVKASNNDGVWNQIPASFSFAVDPPWWGTWWFRVVLSMAVVGFVVGFYKWRIYSIKQKKNELERKVKQKTKEVVQQKDEILVQSKKLKESYHNLELLSDVGKSITSNLSVSKIIDTVYENVNSLMKAEVFWIGIYNANEDAIVFNGALEAGEKLPSFSCKLSEKNRLAIWCFNNQEEVYINDYAVEYKKYTTKVSDAIAGKPTQSIIYVPLISQGKAIGVLSVQSYDKDAYGEHHLSLIRNIAVHTKIALENASAYEKITEQSRGLIRQKEQIENKNQELLELNKEKNHLIGIVAHDLRNPLTSALTIGGLLKTGEKLTEEQEEYADHILNAMERMNQMVNRILDIKAIESKSLELNLERVNLAEVLQEVHENFKDALDNKQIELKLSSNSTTPVAQVDRNYLTQVYENLISNAIKFSPPSRVISVGFQQNNGHIITEISDQGPGLTAEDMELLFQRYQRLSAKPTGGEQSTGLGLSIVKKYVEAMNGSVWAENTPGEGATFKVQFNQVDGK